MTSKSIASSSVLLAALLACAGIAQAQQSTAEVRAGAHNMTSASATSNVPSRSGEASTMTNGVPNLMTSNPQPGEMGIESKLTVRRAGEMSSMVNGVPNMDPNDHAQNRARSYAGGEPNLSVMGASPAYSYGYSSGYNPGQADNYTHGHGTRNGVGVPANAPAGTPSVFDGGTPE
jgi:hypothetical protein